MGELCSGGVWLRHSHSIADLHLGRRARPAQVEREPLTTVGPGQQAKPGGPAVGATRRLAGDSADRGHLGLGDQALGPLRRRIGSRDAGGPEQQRADHRRNEQGERQTAEHACRRRGDQSGWARAWRAAAHGPPTSPTLEWLTQTRLP